MTNILREADRLVHGARNKSYGHPAVGFTRTGKMWEAILGVPVNAEQVALCMIALKMSRLCHTLKRDSIVDIAGYAANIEMIIEWRKRK